MPTWKEYYNKTYQVDPDDAVSTYLDSGPVYPDKQEKEENNIDPEDTEGESEKKNFFEATPKVVTAKNNVNINEASSSTKKSKKVIFDTGRPNKRSNII
jgi:hypothetical protein